MIAWSVCGVGSRLFRFPAGKGVYSARMHAGWRIGARRQNQRHSQGDARTAEECSLEMIPRENTATMPATSYIDLEKEGRSTQGIDNVHERGKTPLLSHEQLQRELSYRSSIALVRSVLNAGLISGSEFDAVQSKLAEQFSPVWGGLYQNDR